MKYVVILVVLLSLGACSEKKESSIEGDMIANQTPDVLDDNVSDYGVESFKSRKYAEDIINKLYYEAIDKDLELESINDQISKMYSASADSTAAYIKYRANNIDYWQSADLYISQLNDSMLLVATRKMFRDLEESYKESLVVYENKLDILNDRAVVLNDQLLLIKLLVTQPMMANYQSNEVPEIKQIEDMILRYDSAIVDTRSYLKGLSE